MTDLKLKYKEKDNEKELNYEKIFDFTDAFELGEFDYVESSDVSIIIFENPLNTREFSTIKECYEFLIKIMGG